MPDAPAALVLAAGFGTRLRPLTDLRPKALCPVGGVPLLDHALDRVAEVTAGGRVAVNVHHHRQQLEEHLAGRDVHVSVEEPEPLGTAGAVANLRDWLDGAPVLVVNADAWCDIPLARLVDGWDGRRVRILVLEQPGDLGAATFAGASLLPWPVIERLRVEPAGLYEVVWRSAMERGEVDLVAAEGTFVDCGTPERYLLANLLASDGENVVGAGAVVRGRLEQSVVWDGAQVDVGEHLVRSVRATGGVTVGPLDVSLPARRP